MPIICQRCRRANPDKALYCHYDGNLLRAGTAPTNQFPQPFHFPSSRQCSSLEQFVEACYLEWEDARAMLADGTFAGFFSALGRADLAKTARDLQTIPDRDIALTNFLAALPVVDVQGPKLNLQPRRLSIGPLRVGEQKMIPIRILNDGRGLLFGKISVADGAGWMRVPDGPTPSISPIKTSREQVVHLRVVTDSCSVGQNYIGKLTVVSNGGAAEVPVRLDLVANPFAKSPFQGAMTPHDMARRMKEKPDDGARLLHSGDIARWFAANGWTYPIEGEPAPERAAVQQFFEELGLAKPPLLALSTALIQLSCTPPESPTGEVILRGGEKRIVYARVQSDSNWLIPTVSSISGKEQVTIAVRVDSRQLGEDRIHQATLRIIGNGGQVFTVRVQVDVKGNKKTGWFGSGKTTAPAPQPIPIVAPQPAAQPATWLPVQPQVPTATTKPTVAPTTAPVSSPTVAPPQPSSQPAFSPAPKPPAGKMFLQGALIVGLLLGLLTRLILFFPADLAGRLLSGSQVDPRPGTLQSWLEMPSPDEGFLRLIVISLGWLGALGGVWLTKRYQGRPLDYVWGAFAGCFAGALLAATLGCCMVVVDTIPRTLLRGMAVLGDPGVVVATGLWLILILLTWAILGAILFVVWETRQPGVTAEFLRRLRPKAT
jgi:hypothetical protein